MKKIIKLDYLLLLPLFITCTLGIIMMYSASSIVAVQHYGYNSRHFVDSQLTKLFLGTIGLIVCAILPYEIWKKRIVSICIMIGGIFLLIMVLWKGKVVNNAQSWIFGIQPAEFLKLGTIIVTARFFALRQGSAKQIWIGGGKLLFFLATIFFLIYKQPNLGSALLILGIVFSIFLCSGININLLIKRTIIGAIFWLPILYFLIQFSLSDVQKTRITTIINPFVDAQGNGYQLVNSFIAIGSGGIIGRGFGNSIQKTGYLPEPHTDFIMAIVSEELGYIGVFIIMAGVLAIVLRSLKIAQLCEDPFGSFIAIGIGCMIGLQSVVNLGGITGILPLTGTPFPFVSFGGSSLMVNLIAIGILLNISIFNKIKFNNYNI
ncbi:FtsW/RodA/SpoVE family cell cycle protein [Bacillus toyonensis]|uniref:FtsW/RodA/SpoVE family cell cycle protein n=1 Tax=Bacillus toyonensis TaxID=155322 RepID=UPI002175B41A|nr:FtsW/RodA/SpoVE family cell cycle protein [Bacillus toyonensis]